MKTIHEEDSPTDVFKKEFRNMLDLRDHGIKCNVCKKNLIEEINIESHLKLWDYLKFVNFIEWGGVEMNFGHFLGGDVLSCFTKFERTHEMGGSNFCMF